MGHRTKVNVSVDSHNELVIRGKLGDYDYEIAETLSNAVSKMACDLSEAEEAGSLPLMFYAALQEVCEGSIGLYSDFSDDPSMDVHVGINIESMGGSIYITYRPDNGPCFAGDFLDFEDEYGLT